MATATIWQRDRHRCAAPPGDFRSAALHSVIHSPMIRAMTDNIEQKTALEWLAQQYPDSPKKRLKEWFAKGRIQLDGEVIFKHHLRFPDPGDRLGMGQPNPAAKIFFKSMPTRIHAQLNLLYIDSLPPSSTKAPAYYQFRSRIKIKFLR